MLKRIFLEWFATTDALLDANYAAYGGDVKYRDMKNVEREGRYVVEGTPGSFFINRSLEAMERLDTLYASTYPAKPSQEDKKKLLRQLLDKFRFPGGASEPKSVPPDMDPMTSFDPDASTPKVDSKS